MLRVGVAVLAAAAAGLTASPVPSTSRDGGAASPFGSSRPVHVGRVGGIEIDLAGASRSGLRRVTCSGGPLGTACYIAG